MWDSLDVEVFGFASSAAIYCIINVCVGQFLTTFTISLMKSLDIRSESAVKLLAEFLDMDADGDAENPRANAEHFAHGKHPFNPCKDNTLSFL